MAGWLTGWEYRKSHVIYPATGAGSDYSVKVKVYKSALFDFFTEEGYFATFSDRNQPCAMYYNGKTYIVFAARDAIDPYIMSYDHTTGQLLGPYKVGSSPIPQDAHGIAVVMVSNDGYIHVFFGCHTGPLKHSRSTNTEDISSWTAQANIGSGHTYPMLTKDSSGKLYLVIRYYSTKGSTVMYISTDNGANWGSAITLITTANSSDDIYHGEAYYHESTGRIYIPWIYYDAGLGGRKNVYCAYYKISDGHMYSVGGTDLGTSIDASEGDSYCKVRNTAVETDYAKCCTDSDGTPFVWWCEIISSSPETWRLYISRWTGAAWTSPVEVAGGDNGDRTIGSDCRVTSGTGSGASLELYRRGGTLDVYAEDMLKTISSNGGATWGTPTVIKSPEPTYNNNVYVWFTFDMTDDIQICFAQHGTLYGAATKAYAYGTSGFINPSDSVSCEGHCLDNFGDVRFTDDDEVTLLDYWIEEKSDGDYAIIWVKVNDSLESSVQTIYIYYGKAGETTTSDPDATLVYYHDFEDDTIGNPPSKFLTYDKLSVQSVSGQQGSKCVQCLGSYTQDQVMDMSNIKNLNIRIKMKNASPYQAAVGVRFTSQSPYTSIVIGGIYGNPANYFGIVEYVNGVKGSETYVAYTWGTGWRNLEIWACESRIDAEIDGTLCSITCSLALQTGKCTVRSWNNVTAYYDYIRVRKYVNPEPTHGIWGPETKHALKLSSSSATSLMQVLDMI